MRCVSVPPDLQFEALAVKNAVRRRPQLLTAEGLLFRPAAAGTCSYHTSTLFPVSSSSPSIDEEEATHLLRHFNELFGCHSEQTVILTVVQAVQEAFHV